MRYCYELSVGCSGCPVRSTVCTALCHSMLHGLIIVSFVFSNSCYPPFYYVDFMFGGSGAALMVIAFVTAWTVNLKKYQPLRAAFALLITLNIIFMCMATLYYTIERWNDVMVTALVKHLRRPPLRDFPDHLWFTIVIILCINIPVFLYYLIYITSFMCNDWKSFLFTTPYQNDMDIAMFPPVPVSLPTDKYSQRSYKPYPVQPPDQSR